MIRVDSQSILLKILYFAFIEIREVAVLGTSGHLTNKTYKISDLLHNVPLAIAKAESSDDYDKILENLKARARMKGVDEWLEGYINRMVCKTPIPDSQSNRED